jgi:hypothetical protein
MEEKKILLVSPNQNLIKQFFVNTINKLNLPNNLKFVKLTEQPEELEISKIYRVLLSLKKFNTYKSIIILYPLNNPKYKYSQEEFSALNELLYSKGLKNGVAICTVGANGQMEGYTITENLKSYLIQVAKN